MSRGRRSGDAVRLVAHSGSPLTFSPRDDKIPYAAGCACLAWPFWATAPLVQARPAPPFLSAMSVILPYIAPLLLLLETNTEADAVVAVAGGGVVALS